MNQTFSIKVDKQIYDDAIISKAVYWHTAKFLIDRAANENIEIITFSTKEKLISDNERETVLAKFNQDLNDYKLRQIIIDETKDIRTILYVKAFAHNDDFEDNE
jgi:His-Xaa-Ser system protein HxsD